jgi:uncharacterized membrane protein (DUF4010 family)
MARPEGIRRLIPTQALDIGLVLALSFLIGLEREEHKQQDAQHPSFGGVRTFPLFGLVSYALAVISAPERLPWMLGLVIVGGFLIVSYHHKLATAKLAGVTSEVSGLVTYVVALLVFRHDYWLAATVAIVCVLLLELKQGLEGLAKRIAPEEIFTFSKFLLLTAVILPIVPDQDVTRFQVNPFRAWLVVAAVSGVSYGSYLLQRLLKGRGGVMLSALLGGAYSSTATTVALARQAKAAGRPRLYSGSMLAASGVMYVRLLVLVAFFDVELALKLAPAFGALAIGSGIVGWALARGEDDFSPDAGDRRGGKNPLELAAALLFAVIFVIVLVVTHLVHQYLGSAGLYTLAAVVGVTDVAPFVLGLAQGHSAAASTNVAAVAITIAASSNSAVKAVYAYVFADRETGRRALTLLLGLAGLGLLPILWLA